MKKLILLFCLILGAHLSYGQCNLLTETGAYDALCFQSLSRNNQTFGSSEIAIARTGSAGLFIIKLNFSDTKFQGNIILFLDDNTRITLTNRNIHWKVNGELFGQYNLTSDEIKRLKTTNIRAVRYWTCTFPGLPDCENATEDYNVDFKGFFNSTNKRVDFPKLISELYAK